jgi:hypothetical protein
MAVIKQTDFATGRKEAPTPYEGGQVACAVFEYTFAAAWTATTDIAAIGYLPAGCVPVLVRATSTALGSGCTMDVGFMSGALGSTDTAQTSGDELIDGGAAHSAEAAGTLADLLAITAVDYHRPIGLKTSADVTADTAKTVRLQVWYKPA